MLRYQARYLFTREDLCGVSGVDITVSEDHRKGKIKCIEKKIIDYFQTFIKFLTFNILFFFIAGKFRMVLKLIIRYESNKEPFLILFQIASVEYKDDIKVLPETVLNHIGRSLQEISQGGMFKIDLDGKQEFCLSFSG
jgi:hypothetical protein